MLKGAVKNQRGIVALVPLLAIGAVVLLVVSFRTSSKEQKNSGFASKVLSESNDNEVFETRFKKIEDRIKNELDLRKENVAKMSPAPTAARIEGKEDNRGKDKAKLERKTKVELEKEEKKEDEKEAENEDISDDKEKETEIKSQDEKKGPVWTEVVSQDGRFQFKANGVSVKSNFPLVINSQTNELTVKTPGGERVVTVLPDKAVQNVVDKGFIDSSLGIEVRDGKSEVEYEVKGVDERRLFGLLKVAVRKSIRVSAQSGQVIGVEQPFFSKLLDILSF